jgi:tRNA-dihydrouridine synthase B
MRYNLPYLKYRDLIIKSRAVLAPMAGVTDIPFRKMVRKWSKDCLVFTEMINATVFVQARKVQFIAQTVEEDHPIVYQFSGDDPYYMAKAAERAQKIGAFGVDINMGCPTPKIVKKGDGASLLRDQKKAREIFEEVVKSVDIPVSVKIRAGWDDNSIIATEYALLAEECGLSAIAIHGRTRCQFYQGLANWDYIKEAQEAVNIPVIGSGDLWTPEDARRMIDYTGCAGLWVARGCLGNPWIVAQMDSYIKTGEIKPDFSNAERVGFMLEHLGLMVEYLTEKGAVPASRKHIAWCIKNMPESDPVRIQVNSLTSYVEVADVLKRYQEFLVTGAPYRHAPT